MVTEIREVSRSSLHEINLIMKWWSQQGDGINPEFLSDFGYMVDVDSVPTCACFLYPILGSKVAWIGWPISDPESKKEDRDLALNLLFARMHTDALEMGYKWIWTTSGLEHVQGRLKRLGYIEADTNINQYWKELV